ncbi:MAG: hypothetical protein CVV52_03640 [Spirochaetae bacterium HGW-Spirochaetae-8]|nr:MAG: hypothetical protein CVV52_03640 [Spirochaetae bacterium HGW-Spirochaetae-8]
MRNRFTLRPLYAYRALIVLQFALLLAYLVPVLDASGFMLYLFVVFSMTLRWRFPIAPSYMLLDCAVVATTIAFFPSNTPFLALYIFYFSYNNRMPYSLLPIATIFLFATSSIQYLIVLMIVPGYMLYLWQDETTLVRRESDDLRQKIHHMEQTEAHLLQDYHDAGRISQLTERQRIAEILHDNLGHELTAAHLTVKAIGTLLASDQPQKALQFQQKAEERLNTALTQLKTAVRQIEPDNDSDIRKITSLLENFVYPIHFSQTGDLSQAPPHLRQLMYISLKEALTNITKHARPTTTSASIECTQSIVRLVLENDGIIPSQSAPPGNGLRYMRKRIETVHGSMSTSWDKTFKIIIILPIQG